MRKLSTIIFVLLFNLLIAMPLAIAQAGSFTFVNESNVRIDEATVQQAAQVLIDRYNADVVVYAVVSGGSNDFRRRLTDKGLIVGFDGNMQRTLAIYFATEEQYSEIRWGAAFNNIDGAEIRSDALNPGLRSEDFTGAVVNTLNAVDSQMSDSLIVIKRIFGGLLSSSFFWFTIVAIIMVVILIKTRGISGGSGSGGWSSSSSDSSSSWSSDSGSSDSGGGSDGGSWND